MSAAKRRGGKRPTPMFSYEKQSLFYRRSAIEKRILEVVKLLAYNADAVAGGCADASKEMHAELDVLASQLREIDIARWKLERVEREASEAVAKIT